jgi:hypothetical protein
MVFGRQTALPLDTLYATNEITPCAAAYTQWLQSSVQFVHTVAWRHLGVKLRAQKQYFDRRINKRMFEVGELILWLHPQRTKLPNVWQGPYEVVDKANEWHHYTIEREGKRRRATASQLKKFHPSEIGGDIRRPPSRYPEPEWVRTVMVARQGEVWESPVVVELDPKFRHDKTVTGDKFGLEWRIRGTGRCTRFL